MLNIYFSFILYSLEVILHVDIIGNADMVNSTSPKAAVVLWRTDLGICLLVFQSLWIFYDRSPWFLFIEVSFEKRPHSL